MYNNADISKERYFEFSYSNSPGQKTYNKTYVRSIYVLFPGRREKGLKTYVTEQMLLNNNMLKVNN